MRLGPGVLLAMAPLALARPAGAQRAADTLPERVVQRAYQAFNRADAAAFYSFFAPLWYHSGMEDSSLAATRRTREDAARELAQWWATGGNRTAVRMLHRIVVGPYVVDEQAVMLPGSRDLHLDIFEVRHGKIVHEWESGSAPASHSAPPGH